MSSQVLERHTAQEVLRAVLHSILFHRLFGTVKPQTFEVLDVTMVSAPSLNSLPSCPPRLTGGPHLTHVQPGVDDPEIRKLVDSKVEAFWKSVEGGYNKSGKVRVRPGSWIGQDVAGLSGRYCALPARGAALLYYSLGMVYCVTSAQYPPSFCGWATTVR